MPQILFILRLVASSPVLANDISHGVPVPPQNGLGQYPSIPLVVAGERPLRY
jgi:hypothetical protein